MREEEYKKAFEFIDKRWECQLHRPLHAAGFFLNPGLYYDNPEKVACQEVMMGFHQCLSRLTRDVEVEDNISDKIILYREASGVFGLDIAKRQRKTKSPGT